MAEHLSFSVRGFTVEFHIYVTVSGSDQKVRQLEPFFRRLPDAHLAVMYPIFVMDKKPGGRAGGGTWPPGLVRSQVMGAGHARNTGIPDADVDSMVVARGRGMIGLSKDRWERPIARLPFTVFHEVGHCVDIALGLVPSGANDADFAGMETNRCGAGNMVTRRAVEAYARLMCSPSAIYHTLPARETAASANQRLSNVLRRSPAFRAVPATWQPR